ncbi:hypothetical protein BGZ60DRAFT_565634 [Tricladium varicosporioides]|nr:hypothetical protein BGZ60DRAFT_565634 [Hymenoscyphus varicosporioides]
MSNTSNNPRAPDSSNETAEQAADEILRNILDNTRSAEEISPSGELYRFLERYHRSRGTDNRTSQNQPNLHSMSSSEQNRRLRRQQRDSEGSPLFVLPPQNSESTPRERAQARFNAMSARRAGRPRLQASDRYLDRHRAALGEVASAAARNTISNLADLTNDFRDAARLEDASAAIVQDAGRHLQAAHAFLDGSVPNLPSPNRDEVYSGEAEPSRRKRRKLDSDGMDSGYKGFSYGRYGQVEPGELKMEIVSCDGGMFPEQGDRDYKAENLLRTDDSVYCTQSNRCNLVLRHQGATVFCLKELVIKAPHAGYTAPVQEGMVFISMTSDDLLTRTAQYQIQYSPARPRRREGRPVELPPILSIRHNNDGSMSTAQARARRLVDIGNMDEDCDYRTAQIPSDFTSNQPPFQVTTEWSDSEDEDNSNLARHRHTLRRLGIRTDDTDSSDDPDEQNNSANWHEDYILGMGRPRRETPRTISLAEAAEASQIATQEAVRAVGGELMAPHARFFIERDKSKCTVKFDPPVSGRFILLKMWSPHNDPSGNIDIQSVIARGFAGPRFFPAITLR